MNGWSFIPRENPIGFGASDFLEVAWLLLLLLGIAAWRVRRIAEKTCLCMILLGVLPVVLRIILLPNYPVPRPEVYDEPSHLLVADTLCHFRLANPAHALPQFFETFFILQQPTYASVYPLGQGLMLALGRALFGIPWAGVLISTALFCALVYWMLRAYVPAEWALLGGLLAVAEFGPLSYWMNGYWGGTLAALAGCMVFGSLPRLRDTWQSRYAALLGLGLSVHWLTRPFETIFICVGVALYFAPVIWPQRGQVSRALAVVVLTVLPAITLSMLHNKRVTGEWFTLPEMLSQQQYGVPDSLTFQARPVPQRALPPDQQTEYEIQMSFRQGPAETLALYGGRLLYRVRAYRFFYITPLYLALPLFFTALTEWTIVWVLLTLVMYVLGMNFYAGYQLHYFAGVTCLFLLVSITALRRLQRFAGRDAARLIMLLCGAHFLFWYSTHLFDGSAIARALGPYETWSAIHHGPSAERIAVQEQIANIPGQLLVFVRYYRPNHRFQDEWVINGADIDGARVVWAGDLGDDNDKLIHYYPGRRAFLLEPEYRPPRLRPYEATYSRISANSSSSSVRAAGQSGNRGNRTGPP